MGKDQLTMKLYNYDAGPVLELKYFNQLGRQHCTEKLEWNSASNKIYIDIQKR